MTEMQPCQMSAAGNRHEDGVARPSPPLPPPTLRLLPWWWRALVFADWFMMISSKPGSDFLEPVQRHTYMFVDTGKTAMCKNEIERET